MTNRIGPGPVFVYESLILARRWQGYAGRALFVLAILIGLAVAWSSTLDIWSATQLSRTAATRRALANAGESFFYALAGIQITIVFLAAPAAAGGAICQDRAQGILTQLAMTDLSSAEIVLGKLASRVAPVFGLLTCAFPVTALAALLGGIDPQAIFGLFAVSVAIAVLGCALAIAISLWAVKTHESVMAVIMLWLFWLMSLPLWEGNASAGYLPPPPDWFRKTNPLLLVYSPYVRPGYVGVWDIALFVGGAFAFAAGWTGLTIAVLRRSIRSAGATPIRKSLLHRILDIRLLAWLERLPGPSLDGNPVLWREWHRNRPSRLARLVWAAYSVAAITMTAWGLHDAFRYGVDSTGSGSAVLAGAVAFQFAFGLLLLCILAPTSLAEELTGNSLDALLTTPLSAQEIVWGKWLGTYRTVFLMTILPALGAAVIAWLAPPIARYLTAMAIRRTVTIVELNAFDRVAGAMLVLCEMLSYGAAITSVGLALATRIPRLSRAVAINVTAFVLVGIGWPSLFELCLWRWFEQWTSINVGIQPAALNWISPGLLVISPFAAPQSTLGTLTYHWGSSRTPAWCLIFGWTVVAWSLAGVVYWATCQTFDRSLGRMPESPD
jgi:ABC-type transport system involved in multi-copper enzyme maturation permease subunit